VLQGPIVLAEPFGSKASEAEKTSGLRKLSQPHEDRRRGFGDDFEKPDEGRWKPNARKAMAFDLLVALGFEVR